MKKNSMVIAALLFAGSILSSCNANTKQEQSEKPEVSETSKTEKKVKTIKLTKAEFLQKVANYEDNPKEWKYLGDKPAIIDFYADWCGPCKMIAPILEELAAEYGDKIYIYKVDTEQEQELAGIFQIRSIPALLFVPMEGQPQMAAGAMPKADLKKGIDEFLLKKKDVAETKK